MSIICGIFHWRMCACGVLEVVNSALDAVVRAFAGALCHGGTSESVRKSREMAVGKVGRFGGCYSLTC